MNDHDNDHGTQFGDSDAQYWGCLFMAMVIVLVFIVLISR